MDLTFQISNINSKIQCTNIFSLKLYHTQHIAILNKMYLCMCVGGEGRGRRGYLLVCNDNPIATDT